MVGVNPCVNNCHFVLDYYLLNKQEGEERMKLFIIVINAIAIGILLFIVGYCFGSRSKKYQNDLDEIEKLKEWFAQMQKEKEK